MQSRSTYTTIINNQLMVEEGTYGVPFSHLFPELQISPIQLQIYAIQLEISTIQLEISQNRLDCRYLQLNWRYLQINCRYLQILSIFGDISN